MILYSSQDCPDQEQVSYSTYCMLIGEAIQGRRRVEERIAEEVKKKFPFQNQLIFSSDTMNKKNSKDILKKIVDNKIQILIGTQLISKGFHFPSLNCIVVVDIMNK